MKNLFLILALLVCSNSHSQRKVDWNTQDDCVYQTIKYHENGSIREVGCHNDKQKPTGRWHMYARNGERIATAEFDSEGKKHGDWKVWDDEGNIVAHMIYDHGKRTGTWKAFLADGTVQERKYN